MQLTSTAPAPILERNQRVVGALVLAHQLTSIAKGSFAAGDLATTRKSIADALVHARQANAAAQALAGADNLLDGTTHRFAGHSVLDLVKAASLATRAEPGTDAAKLLTERLFSAEVSSRLGKEAGERSMLAPKVRPHERPTYDPSSGGGDDRNTALDHGVVIDGIGNPVRGGDAMAGPDGERYGADGEPVSSGGDWDGGGDTGI